ncbi:Vomeronasal type-2 receptor 26 [Varanus komodoensis]|nr:Vomeronasal type-2 receptor 26 [Varanus komodoensis]
MPALPAPPPDQRTPPGRHQDPARRPAMPLHRLGILLVYRAPFCPTVCLPELMETVSDLVLRTPRMLVLGDFNLHAKIDLTWAAQDFMASMAAMGLSQHVTGLTHERGNILDLVFLTGQEEGGLRVRNLSLTPLSLPGEVLEREVMGQLQALLDETDFLTYFSPASDPAAFDTIDHGILLDRLAGLGVRGTALQWFHSYLNGRFQKVLLGNYGSAPWQLCHGVPQGSILSPLLFNIYMKQLGEVIRRCGLWNHQYADDTQLYLSFSTNPSEAVAVLNQCLAEVMGWMRANKLKLNPDKTEFLLVGGSGFGEGELNLVLNGVALPLRDKSGFRPGYGTLSALVALYDNLCSEEDRGIESLLVLLDLSVAFGPIDHGILLDRLAGLGVGGTALQWFCSYLNDQFQKVVLGDYGSVPWQLCHGVPQGTILSPLLFNIYMKPLGEVIRRCGLRNHQYADHTQLYLSFSTNPGEAVPVLNQCLAEVMGWMRVCKLKLNPDKMDVLLVGGMDSGVGELGLVLNGVALPLRYRFSSLGVLHDPKLTLEAQVLDITRSTFHQLWLIYQLHHYLEDDCLVTVMHGLASSRLDFCNVLYIGLPLKTVWILQLVQNRAASLLSGTEHCPQITPVLRQLHWLPIDIRAQFKVLMLTYKALNGLGPGYLNEHLRPYMPDHPLRSAGETLLREPSMKEIRRGLTLYSRCIQEKRLQMDSRQAVYREKLRFRTVTLLVLLLLLFASMAYKAETSKCTGHDPLPVPHEWYQPGDLLIGGIASQIFFLSPGVLFQQHPSMETHFQIPIMITKFYQHILALAFAIETINENLKMLPNITLGFHIFDSYNDKKMAFRTTLELLFKSHEFVPNYKCGTERNVIAIIAGYSSDISFQVADILGLYKTPQVAYGSFTEKESDATWVPPFYCMAPSETHQYTGIIHLFHHFGWTWIGIFAVDDDSGDRFLQALEPLLSEKGICSAFTQRIPNEGHFPSFDTLARMSSLTYRHISNFKANAFLLYGETMTFLWLTALLASADAEYSENTTPRHVWILTAQIDFALTSISISWALVFFQSIISFASHSNEPLGYARYLQSIRFHQTQDNGFLKDFWEQAFTCSFPHPGDTEEVDRTCTREERLETIPQTFFEMSMSGHSYSVYNAVSAVARALHAFITSKSNQRIMLARKNPELQTVQPWQIHPFLQGISFNNSAGETVSFNENREMVAGFDITMIIVTLKENFFHRVRVGSVDPSGSEGEQFSIQKDMLSWPQSFNQNSELANVHLKGIGEGEEFLEQRNCKSKWNASPGDLVYARDADADGTQKDFMQREALCSDYNAIGTAAASLSYHDMQNSVFEVHGE